MAATLFKEVSYNLAKLIQDIEMGEIGLPEIQRPFVWPNTKVRDLFDSMYKGFPVGYLLFWANGIGDGHRQIGTSTKQKVPRLLIVDGQQRLTSLYAVMRGVPVVRDDYRQEQISIAFSPLTEKFEVTDAAVRKNPEFIPDISQIWASHTDMFELADEYLTRLRLSRPISAEETKAIRKAINNLDNLQTFPFTALELSSAATEEQVADVFVRINSKGTILNQADFILTLMSVFWDEGRADLERFCRQARQPSIAASPFNYFIQPNPDQLLRVEVGLGFRRARLQHVYSILRGKDLETERFSDELRTQQFEVLREAQQYTLDLQNWHDFLKTLVRAGYRSSQMITSQVALLYAYTFYLIGKRGYHVEAYTLRNVIARWFFMTSLTGRYTGSPETVMEQDLARLRDVSDADGFVAVLDRIVDDTFTDDYWNITLPNELATSSPRSPSLFAYYAALNLLGARALFSNISVAELLDPALKAKKSAVERHHLFPKGYLAKLGITEVRDTNQIANYALVEWADNIAISADSPAKYIPKYEARFRPNELAQMHYWHALPDDWAQMAYQEFLEQRRRRMARVIRDAFASLSAGTRPEPDPDPMTAPAVLALLDDAPAPDDTDDTIDDTEKGLAPRHLMRREFWRAFIQRAVGRAPLPARLGQGINSLIYVPTAEKKRLYWEYSIRMYDAGIDLSIYQSDATENKRVFDRLFARREEIEHLFGATLQWDRNSQGHGSYIRYRLIGGGLREQEAWPETQERMIAAMARFQQAIGPVIQALPE